MGTDDLAAAAAALAEVGARVLETLDARCARAALDARSESPWDRLRAVLRETGTTPVGVVIGARNLWGDRPLGADVVRRFVLCAVESGASRVRATDPLNDPANLEPVARACEEAAADFVPTLIVGPYPPPGDPRWLQEAREIGALPGATAICVSDGAGHLAPAALGSLVQEVGEATGLPVEVQVQAPGGLAPLSATAAVVAGASAVQASAGPVALVSARPSAETLRAALVGGPRVFECNAAALDRAARVVGPMLPADRLRQAAAAVFGPAVAVPPPSRPASSRASAAWACRAAWCPWPSSRPPWRATWAARPSPTRWAPRSWPRQPATSSTAAAGPRWSRSWCQLALGRAGRLRAPVADEVLEACRAADPGPPPLRDLTAVAEEAPPGLSEEDLVLWAMFAETTEQVVARRRSLGVEAASRPSQPAIDRDLLDTLVDVVEASNEAEVSVEISGARVTVRRAAVAAEASAATPGGTPAPPRTTGSSRSSAPWWAPSTAGPPRISRSLEEGQRVAGATRCA